jgi:hypothetical protein
MFSNPYISNTKKTGSPHLRWKPVLLALLVSTSSGLKGDTEAVAIAQETVRRYVEARQTLAAEISRWTEQKELLANTIRLLELENTRLDEQLMAFNETASVSEKEQAELQQDIDRVLNTVGALSARISPLEMQIRNLYLKFPKPLQRSLQPVIQRIPTPDTAVDIGLGARMQNIVALLNEAERFNDRITLAREIRTTSAGEVEVSTLYFGLAGAFFVDANGTLAGVGKPSANGWIWENRDDIARNVRTTLAMYENEQSANFVSLPITIIK